MEVLGAYDETGKTREIYTYGTERFSKVYCLLSRYGH